MRSILRRALLAAALLAPAAAAQRAAPRDVPRDDAAFSFYDRGPYRPSVPRPDSILGYAMGDVNTQYSDQERALLAIAGAARDRVRVEEFAITPERRTMRIYIVSSPENIARLDAIRADLDRIADPRGMSEAELAAVVARTPAVVWIAGSVHGNESPGFETTIQLLYQYAASNEPATLETLRNSLVIINPSSNPDGHERFAVWYRSMGVGDPLPFSQEHREPWSIQGRFNHFRFDMNRDLIATTQPEVQGIVRMMLRWKPMMAIDLHGHVSTYFFPPAAHPVNQNIGPESTRWMEVSGRANADAFDRHGWMYYSRDVFDLYYPGYYDTWPSLTGATGMTFETDGGGHRGLLYRREDGTFVSFRDGIAKHYVASVATIEATAARRQDRVRDYAAFRQAAVAEGRSKAMKRVVLLPGSDPARAVELAATLLRQGIEVRRLAAPLASTSAHAYADDRGATSRRFDAGAYVVDLAQPLGRLARAILEPSPTLDPAFARSQVERYHRNLRRGQRGDAEGYEFYDVTSWTLPRAYGVEAWWTADTPVMDAPLLSLPSGSGVRSVNGELLPVDVGGGVAGGRARSAYVFTSERHAAPALAYHLLADGYRVGVASEPIDAAGRRWPRGTYVVRVSRNDTTLHTRIAQLARDRAVDVTAINTAFTEPGGQFGVGSDPVRDIPRPRIAIVADEGIRQPSYGAIWFGLRERYGIDFTPVGWDALGGSAINEFTTVIIPPGSVRIAGGALENVRRWMQGGGTLITMGNASAWAASEATNLTTARRVAAPEAGSGASPATGTAGAATAGAATASAAPVTNRDTSGQRTASTPDRLAEELIPFRSPSANADTPESVPGAEFDVLLDRTHWLTFGYEQPRLTVMVEGSLFLKPSREGSNVGTFPAAGAFHRAGFIWPDTERLLRGTSFMVAEPVGSGHLVLFTNEPMFRGWWRALDRMVLNAAILGAAF
jgi:hypothetical protein